MFKFLRKTALWIVIAPWALFGLGAASNQVVLQANHDKFPVMVNTLKERVMVAQAQANYKELAADAGIDPTLPAGMIDDTHCVMTDKTHLNFLADVFDLKDGIYSIGDFTILLGEWMSGFAPFIWMFEVCRRLRQE
jgi:hypothetical protein